MHGFPIEHLRTALAGLPDDTQILGTDTRHGGFTLLTSAGRIPVAEPATESGNFEPLNN
ncbi:hypothetical protein [Trinickia sp. EG282A]|uniref:hypothetical protein n=1 Tax=Trinickia sp. EG282A TaxID=3237013 RepID=UPI0034D2CC6C